MKIKVLACLLLAVLSSSLMASETWVATVAGETSAESVSVTSGEETCKLLEVPEGDSVVLTLDSGAVLSIETSGSYAWELTGAGAVTIGSGATVSLTNTASTYSGGTTVAGALTWAGAGTLGTGAVSVPVGGTFTIGNLSCAQDVILQGGTLVGATTEQAQVFSFNFAGTYAPLSKQTGTFGSIPVLGSNWQENTQDATATDQSLLLYPMDSIAVSGATASRELTSALSWTAKAVWRYPNNPATQNRLLIGYLSDDTGITFNLALPEDIAERGYDLYLYHNCNGTTFGTQFTPEEITGDDGVQTWYSYATGDGYVGALRSSTVSSDALGSWGSIEKGWSTMAEGVNVSILRNRNDKSLAWTGLQRNSTKKGDSCLSAIQGLVHAPALTGTLTLEADSTIAVEDGSALNLRCATVAGSGKVALTGSGTVDASSLALPFADAVSSKAETITLETYPNLIVTSGDVTLAEDGTLSDATGTLATLETTATPTLCLTDGATLTFSGAPTLGSLAIVSEGSVKVAGSTGIASLASAVANVATTVLNVSGVKGKRINGFAISGDVVADPTWTWSTGAGTAEEPVALSTSATSPLNIDGGTYYLTGSASATAAEVSIDNALVTYTDKFLIGSEAYTLGGTSALSTEYLWMDKLASCTASLTLKDKAHITVTGTGTAREAASETSVSAVRLNHLVGTSTLTIQDDAHFEVPEAAVVLGAYGLSGSTGTVNVAGGTLTAKGIVLQSHWQHITYGTFAVNLSGTGCLKLGGEETSSDITVSGISRGGSGSGSTIAITVSDSPTLEAQADMTVGFPVELAEGAVLTIKPEGHTITFKPEKGETHTAAFTGTGKIRLEGTGVVDLSAFSTCPEVEYRAPGVLLLASGYVHAFSGDLTLDADGTLTDGSGATLTFPSGSAITLGMDDGAKLTFTGAPKLASLAIVCEGSIKVAGSDAITSLSSAVANITSKALDVSGVTGTKLSLFPISGSISADATWTYGAGAGSESSPVTLTLDSTNPININGGTYYLKGSASATVTPVTMNNATVSYADFFRIGSASYTFGGTTALETPLLQMVYGVGRTSTLLIKDKASLTVTGTQTTRDRSSAVLLQWDGGGTSTLTLQDEATFTVPNAGIALGYGASANDSVNTINVGGNSTLTAKGICVVTTWGNYTATGTYTLNLSGNGCIKLGGEETDTGLLTSGFTRYASTGVNTLAINVSDTPTLEAQADMLVGFPVNFSAGAVLTVKPNGHTITFKPENRSADTSYVYPDDGTEAFTGSGKIKLVGTGVVDLTAYESIADVIESVDSGILLLAPGYINSFSGDLTLDATGTLTDSAGASVTFPSGSAITLGMDDGAKLTFTGAPKLASLAIVCEGSIKVAGSDAITSLSSAVANITSKALDVSGVTGTKLSLFPISGSISADATWTYGAGAGSESSPVTLTLDSTNPININGGTYYLKGSASATVTPVTMNNATVSYADFFRIGSASYTFGGTTALETPLLQMVYGVGRTSTLLIKDKASLTVTGTQTTRDRSSAVLLQWDGGGTSTLTLQDEATFTVPNAGIALGYGASANDSVNTINVGGNSTLTAKGICVVTTWGNYTATGTYTLNLSGNGCIKLGGEETDTGLLTSGFTRYASTGVNTLAINVSDTPTLEAQADMLVGFPVNFSAGAVLTVKPNGHTITFKPENRSADTSYVYPDDGTEAFTGSGKIKLVGTGVVDLTAYESIADVIESVDSGILLLAPGYINSFSGDLTLDATGTLTDSAGASVTFPSGSAITLGMDDGAKLTFTGAPTLKSLAIVCEGSIKVAGTDAITSLSTAVANITSKTLDVTQVTGAKLSLFPVSGVITPDATWTYGAGAGSADSPTTISITSDTAISIDGGEYYLSGTNGSAYESPITIDNATVSYSDRIRVGMETYTLGGTTSLTTPQLYMADGATARVSTLLLKDNAKMTVTGTLTKRNSADCAIVFDRYASGTSTLTLQDNATFEVPSAGFVLGFNGADKDLKDTINVGGNSTLIAKGICVHTNAGAAATGTYTVNLSESGCLKLGGEGVDVAGDVISGITKFGSGGSNTIAINVSGTPTLEARADMMIGFPVTLAEDAVLTIKPAGHTITFKPENKLTYDAAFTGLGKIKLVGEGTVDLSAYAVLPEIESIDAGITLKTGAFSDTTFPGGGSASDLPADAMTAFVLAVQNAGFVPTTVSGTVAGKALNAETIGNALCVFSSDVFTTDAEAKTMTVSYEFGISAMRVASKQATFTATITDGKNNPATLADGAKIVLESADIGSEDWSSVDATFELKDTDYVSTPVDLSVLTGKHMRVRAVKE